MRALSAIDRKALRDLWKIRGQAAAIALVIGCGVAMYIMSISNSESLRWNQDAYYDRYRFADVFAGAKRVPDRLRTRIEAIPGVRRVDTRVVVGATLDVPGMPEPVTGRLISRRIDRGEVPLNDVALLRGRDLAPDRPDEVLVHESFAKAHRLEPGSTLAAILNGRRRELTVAGIVLSPEYVYTVRPGDFLPDDSRFGVLWMNRRALATAFDMEGGFNDVALALEPGASEEEVISRLDRLLEPYGGLGAIPRARQVSNWWVNDQLSQLEGMGRVLPILFLGVGALLLTVVLNRMVSVQRGQIAALKALGYSRFAIARHYLIWGLGISLAGDAVGLSVGIWLGRALLRLQHEFYRFPTLEFRLPPRIVVVALAISLAASVLGALVAVRRAARLPPAEAMRPEPPGHYGPTVLERLGFAAWLDAPSTMILRGLERRPWRALASILGIALGGALMIVGLFSIDGMDAMLDIQFNVAQRQDVTVTFVEPVSEAARWEVAALPGVLDAEPARSVPVRFELGPRSRQAAITGVAANARLFRVVDTSGRTMRLPAEGLVLSDKLASLLGAAAGDSVRVEVLEGARPVRDVPVSAVVEESMGTSAYMDLEALHRLMRESDVLSAAYLDIDESRSSSLYRRLKQLPSVAGVSLRSATIDSFNKTIQESMGVTIFFNVLFAAVIACGVVYNTARVTLSERGHELASLRVLGFTRAEISFILLGELAVLTLAAIPAGLALGYAFSALLVSAFTTEVYRIPLIVTPRVLAYSAITVLAAATVSGFVVRRRLDHLDLIAVLKTRE
ncbi:MAG: ABC transporter permease [Thermoanaerobaculia bacterium]